MQRKWDKAAEAFESAVQRSPDNANFHYDLGEAYLESKQLDKAESALKKATELDPKLFKAFWRLGLVYMYEEKPKEADSALRQAIELNPRMDKPFVALGQLYLNWDADKEAAQVFGECVRANENSAECHNFHGVALKQLKQYDQAVRAFKKAVDLDTGLFEAIYNCGMTYAEWYDESHAQRAQAGRPRLPAEVCRDGWWEGWRGGRLHPGGERQALCAERTVTGRSVRSLQAPGAPRFWCLFLVHATGGMSSLVARGATGPGGFMSPGTGTSSAAGASVDTAAELR